MALCPSSNPPPRRACEQMHAKRQRRQDTKDPSHRDRPILNPIQPFTSFNAHRISSIVNSTNATIPTTANAINAPSIMLIAFAPQQPTLPRRQPLRQHLPAFRKQIQGRTNGQSITISYCHPHHESCYHNCNASKTKQRQTKHDNCFAFSHFSSTSLTASI